MSAASSQLGPVTLEDWARLDEDDSRELVDGHLEEAEVPDLVHEITVSWLLVRLDAWFRPRGGRVLGSGLKFAVGKHRGRMPDLAVFAHELPSARGLVKRPADIMIEVLSPAPSDQRRDRVAKVEDYAAFGASQYWLIDPSLRIFEIMVLTDGVYTKAAQASAGTIAIPGYDVLELDLDALWTEIDALPAE
jgi:Uma2 family endonuclease